MRRNVRFLASNLTELRALLRDRDQHIEQLLERLDAAATDLEQCQHYVRELERQLQQQEDTDHDTRSG